jgi:hypothetical protein
MTGDATSPLVRATRQRKRTLQAPGRPSPGWDSANALLTAAMQPPPERSPGQTIFAGADRRRFGTAAVVDLQRRNRRSRTTPHIKDLPLDRIPRGLGRQR